MRRVTPDSNILVSALMFGGKPLRLLDLALDGFIECAISEPILHETIGVLKDKFKRSAAQLADAETYIRACTLVIKPTDLLDVVKDDPDDNRVLECAVAAKSESIVSGDTDLLRLGQYADIRILKVAEWLDMFDAHHGKEISPDQS